MWGESGRSILAVMIWLLLKRLQAAAMICGPAKARHLIAGGMRPIYGVESVSATTKCR